MFRTLATFVLAVFAFSSIMFSLAAPSLKPGVRPTLEASLLVASFSNAIPLLQGPADSTAIAFESDGALICGDPRRRVSPSASKGR